MRFGSSTTLLLFCHTWLTDCLDFCREIILSGSGNADGMYLALTDYRGRPDFYRDDGVYNLYGEEDGELCYWRIDSTASEFPYWRSSDCSYHPTAIQAQWFLHLSGLEPRNQTVEVSCHEEQSGSRWMVYLIFSVLGVTTCFLVVIGHVICRKRRMRKSQTDCVVCKKSASEAAKVVQMGFTRRPSLL